MQPIPKVSAILWADVVGCSRLKGNHKLATIDDERENCKVLLRSSPGDSCMFCSFGSVKCPSIPADRSCCG